MTFSQEDFKQELNRRVQARLWREHPWFNALFAGKLSRDQVLAWHEQHFYVAGPSHELIAPMYLNCPYPELRVRLLHNLLEEETGCETKSAAHRELFIRLGIALGSTRERHLRIRPLAEVAGLKHYWDWIVRHRTFLEGMSAIGIAGEGELSGKGGHGAG